MSRPIGLVIGVLALGTAFWPSAARAGIYGDDLAKCLVEQTSDADKLVLAQWIFTIMSAHPSATSIARVDEAARERVARQAGRVFETLLAVSCREATAKAVKYEGPEALKGSFKVLGEIAMTALLSDPGVTRESQAFMKYVDEAKLKAAFGNPSNDGH